MNETPTSPPVPTDFGAILERQQEQIDDLIRTVTAQQDTIDVLVRERRS